MSENILSELGFNTHIPIRSHAYDRTESTTGTSYVTVYTDYIRPEFAGDRNLYLALGFGTGTTDGDVRILVNGSPIDEYQDVPSNTELDGSPVEQYNLVDQGVLDSDKIGIEIQIKSNTSGNTTELRWVNFHYSIDSP